MNNKTIIFSHGNDIDGAGCVILSMLAFSNVTSIPSSNVYELESKFRELLNSNSLYSYDYIFITDLALYKPSIDLVNKDKELSNKVKIFDHHISAIKEGYDKYKFSTIKEIDEFGKKTCGTELFYKYLYDNKYIERNSSLDKFVLLTRLEDTWEWKTNNELGEKAHNLAILFNIIGYDKYIKLILDKINNDSNDFELTKEENNVITKRKKEDLKKLKELWKNVQFFYDQDGNYYASLYAEYEMRNEISEYAKSLNIDNLKYIIIVVLDKGDFGQKSYRSIDDNFNVCIVAENHGGNGHPKAASVNITEEQRDNTIILKSNNLRDSLEYIVSCKYDNN